MAERIEEKEMVTLEEILMNNVLEQEALVNLLEKKGIITRAELLEEIKRLRERQIIKEG